MVQPKASRTVLTSIIIPTFQETSDQLRRCLTSIDQQLGVDLTRYEILVINDGQTRVPATLFREFTHLKLQQHNYGDQQGAGVARQRGTDRATGQYVIYMDADDQLFSSWALASFEAVVKQADHQIIIGEYLEQVGNPADEHYVKHRLDYKAAYAKWYRRDFLRQTGVVWHPNLKMYEDYYFVGLVCELADDIYALKEVVYLWTNNPASTVRRDHHAVLRQLATWVAANRYQLAVIKEKLPEWYHSTFCWYIAELALRMQVTQATDLDQALAEQRQLLRENRAIWTELDGTVRFSHQQYVSLDLLVNV
ncbi:glycosyltransferase family 2 protein [Secundilactobacillus kimchicus]|uniref:glycosyltransferase family 2 protein n=1 Tax=Secundilactobacillus kimchicus TaxID=528209 RepID=UPI0024A95B82|nr:glycosyltransferase family A protein [Secundilactobacillus kimchicus]